MRQDMRNFAHISTISPRNWGMIEPGEELNFAFFKRNQFWTGGISKLKIEF